MSDFVALRSKLHRTAWPRMLPKVGDLALYDSLIAGCLDSVARGGLVDTAAVPIPDAATVAFMDQLRARARLNNDETDLLTYFDLLEEIRRALAGTVQDSSAS